MLFADSGKCRAAQKGVRPDSDLNIVERLVDKNRTFGREYDRKYRSTKMSSTVRRISYLSKIDCLDTTHFTAVQKYTILESIKTEGEDWHNEQRTLYRILQ